MHIPLDSYGLALELRSTTLKPKIPQHLNYPINTFPGKQNINLTDKLLNLFIDFPQLMFIFSATVQK